MAGTRGLAQCPHQDILVLRDKVVALIEEPLEQALTFWAERPG
jgi:hypothetical protein